MEQPGNQNQFRFLIAAVLSMIVLFAWSYFYAPTRPVSNTNTEVAANSNANTPQAAQQAIPAATPAVRTTCEETVARENPQLCAGAAVIPDAGPPRTVTIRSPLYEVKLDSKGALASSWVILKNRSSDNSTEVYADGSNENSRKPLELISQRAVEQGELPFRLLTDDQVLNADLNGRNY